MAAMAGLRTHHTTAQLYEILCDSESLAAFDGFHRLHQNLHHNQPMLVYQNLPFMEIKELVNEEEKNIFSKIPENVVKEANVKWEHVGSTSINGMPGTLFPDCLILFDEVPAPREVFSALLEAGFVFIGSGPLNPQDVWFMKTMIRPGSRLHEGWFKVHLTPRHLGPSRMLLETRDRCNTNTGDFDAYKNTKLTAAKFLEEGDILGYKNAKGSCPLIHELAVKHGCLVKL